MSNKKQYIFFLEMIPGRSVDALRIHQYDHLLLDYIVCGEELGREQALLVVLLQAQRHQTHRTLPYRSSTPYSSPFSNAIL